MIVASGAFSGIWSSCFLSLNEERKKRETKGRAQRSPWLVCAAEGKVRYPAMRKVRGGAEGMSGPRLLRSRRANAAAKQTGRFAPWLELHSRSPLSELPSWFPESRAHSARNASKGGSSSPHAKLGPH